MTAPPAFPLQPVSARGVIPAVTLSTRKCDGGHKVKLLRRKTCRPPSWHVQPSEPRPLAACTAAWRRLRRRARTPVSTPRPPQVVLVSGAVQEQRACSSASDYQVWNSVGIEITEEGRSIAHAGELRQQVIRGGAKLALALPRQNDQPEVCHRVLVRSVLADGQVEVAIAIEISISAGKRVDSLRHQS